MAFSSSKETGCFCDKCGKKATEDDPALSLTYTAGRGNAREYHNVKLHFTCLSKIVLKEKQRAD